MLKFESKMEAYMEFYTTTEMAKIWNVSRRRVTTLCIDGRIEGAFLKGNTWLIPCDAKKPEDPRKVRNDVQCVTKEKNSKKQVSL